MYCVPSTEKVMGGATIPTPASNSQSGLPSVARGLALALDKVPPEMRGYKNQLPIREALLAYLSRISA